MKKHSVCPWWLGYLLLIPFRKIRHNPKEILEPYIKQGMKVIDYGSAMGYFSLQMARMVGENGKVYCFDIQEKMLNKLVLRAKKAKLDNRIETRLVTKSDAFSGLDRTTDFTLLFFVAHEVPDQADLFKKLATMMKPGALLLFAEPDGHVTLSDFEHSLALAKEAGFEEYKKIKLGKNHSVIMERMT